MYRTHWLIMSAALALVGGVGVGLESLLVVTISALLIHAGLCWKYRDVPLVFVVALFLLISPFEVLITQLFGLDYYYLVVHGQIGFAIYLQSMLCVPALALFVEPARVERSGGSPLSNGLQAILLFVGYFLVAFGVRGRSVLEGGYDVYRENIAQGSGLIEYLLLLFVFVAVQLNHKFTRWLFGGLLAFYFFKCALLGFRVQAVMSALILVAVLLKNVSGGRMLLLAVAGFCFALLLGGLKHSGDLVENAALLNSGYIQSPHSGSLVSSTNILSFVDLAWFDGLKILWAFWVPFDWVAEYVPWGQPGKFVQSMVPTPGGVLAGVYAYLVAGVPGVIVVGLCFAWVIRAYICPSDSESNSFLVLKRGVALVVLAFAPRWALYDLGNYGFRMAFTYALLTFAVLLFVQAVAQVRTSFREAN